MDNGKTAHLLAALLRLSGLAAIGVVLFSACSLGYGIPRLGPPAADPQLTLPPTDTPAANGVIDLWYGEQQTFGLLGKPQKFINVMGNIQDADGLRTVLYSLNGGSLLPVSLGPDKRRLEKRGDFNVEIPWEGLMTGANQLSIVAIDLFGRETIRTMTVYIHEAASWPLPYSINWVNVGLTDRGASPTSPRSAVTNLQDAVQVVDGRWLFEGEGTARSLRTAAMGYDRMLAIGDQDWTDYEVTVPVTFYATQPTPYPSNGAGFGIILRWNGHSAEFVDCETLHCGWLPRGATVWYEWDEQGQEERFTLTTNGRYVAYDYDTRLTPGVRYIFKGRVETPPSGGASLYFFKVWPEGQPEPAGWNMSGAGDLDDPQHGSAVLIAHHVDAAFGNVTITPVP